MFATGQADQIEIRLATGEPSIEIKQRFKLISSALLHIKSRVPSRDQCFWAAFGSSYCKRLSNGTLNRIALADPGKTAARLKAPGLFVSVDAPVEGREFRTDVSLLHSSGRDKPTTLDFDWLFSSGNDDQEPAVGLNTMTEVQARVIAVSPPIRSLDTRSRTHKGDSVFGRRVIQDVP